MHSSTIAHIIIFQYYHSFKQIREQQDQSQISEYKWEKVYAMYKVYEYILQMLHNNKKCKYCNENEAKLVL